MAKDGDRNLAQVLIHTIVRSLQDESGNVTIANLSSVLGITVDSPLLTLKFALGPLALQVRADKLGAWCWKTGVQFWKEWQQERRTPAGTSYTLRATKSGLLVAENTDPSTLRDMPLQLPEHAEVPLSTLAPAKQSIHLLHPDIPTFRRIDGAGVFRDLWAMNRTGKCPECGRLVSGGGLVLGHAFTCSRNPLRKLHQASVGGTSGAFLQTPARLSAGRCVSCGNQLFRSGGVTSGHAAGCFLDPSSLGLLHLSKRGTTVGIPQASMGAGRRPPGIVKTGLATSRLLRVGLSGDEDVSLGNVLSVVGTFKAGTEIAVYNAFGTYTGKATAKLGSTEIRQLKAQPRQSLMASFGINATVVAVEHRDLAHLWAPT